MEPIKKLIVYGTKIELIKGVEYLIKGDFREKSPKHEIDIENSVLELVLEDETTWLCDSSSLHEVFPELDPALHSPNSRATNSDVFSLPLSVDQTATERGIVGKVLIKVLRVFAKRKLEGAIGEIALRLENKHLLHGISEKSEHWQKISKEDYLANGAALFSLTREFEFKKFENRLDNKPYFLFIHGTNSDTRGAFYDLHSSLAWSTLFDIYRDNVIAFQHRSLTESPLENAVKLAELLPDGSELHLLTHSRGGLIGDILNKYCSNGESLIGFADYHIALLEKEKRTDDIKSIEALNRIFKKKKIIITKFIRIACPGAGTKLASKRLDHILNVFFNLMGGVFGDILKELLSAAVENKDNVDVLPGLEAMNPESPFIKILNDPSENIAIDGRPLVVIAGNGRINLSTNGLLVILGKLFYWQRNDLVVNTDSMYLGAKRKNKIQYFFDQDFNVNHVKYFENNKTREAINLAFKTEAGSLIPGFKAVSQYAVPSADRALLEHGELYPESHLPTGTKPIVVLLPGIMGSNLTQKDKELWLHYGHILKGGLMDLKYPNLNEIVADSVVKTSYYKLFKRLSTNYDVVVYPFDWRRPLPECAKELNSKIEGLFSFDQPIKIIGHSMGGVLVRDFIISHKETWQRLNASKDFRLLFLGSPLSGSHRILTVLFGKDAIIKKLSLLDLFHTKKELIKMFAKFPGILGLLPLTDPIEDPKNDFAKMETWEKIRDAFGESDWPLPTLEDLSEFRTYRSSILQERDNLDYSNMVYIAGKDKMTPCGYYLDHFPPKKELHFLYTGEGDQSVSWELGIPKQLRKDAVYYTHTSHGALANDPKLFNGIEEILSIGNTKLLSNSKPLLRSEEKVFRIEPESDFDLSEYGLVETVLGLRQDKEPIGSQIPVSVSVSNGDLRYASYPILAGHFLNDSILDAEIAIDYNLNGSLKLKHRLGLYPGEIGSNAIFKKIDDNDFAGAIILGMGEPDLLTSFQLSKSVEQAVLSYLLDIRGRKTPEKRIGVSSLVIGSGYGGLSIENSMDAIISGVNRANEKIKLLSGEDNIAVQDIEFVELYADRALNCMYALNQLVNRENTIYSIILGNKRIRQLLGIRKRIPLDISENWWNRITVKYKSADKETRGLGSMVFGASTGDSREEENEIHNSTPLIDIFISEVSHDNQWSSCTAKTLFELMIPNALKEKLKRKGNISWILDSKTASYPWELLQDSTVNAKPLCINSGMIRQLSTSQYRINIKRVSEQGALIVADPLLYDFIGQLAGAEEEGLVVKKVLQSAGYPVTDLIGTNASEIVRELFCKDYSIIHLAGHGVFNPDSPKESGMVIGRNIFLTVFEIQQMPVVPELVFVNCCYLGSIREKDEKYYHDRYKLAANIGTELISIGVKAVVAAGWAVNDTAALDFSKVFYQCMFAGQTLGEAVKSARSEVYEKYPNNNTWGAYQCYGEPHFKLRNIPKKIWPKNYIVPEEVEIHLDNLLNQLQMGNTVKKVALDELDTIMKAVYEQDNLINAAIREKEGKIYLELGMYEEAVKKFENLLCMEKADFSFSCMETYCNTRLKLLVKNTLEKSNNIEVLKVGYKKAKQVIKDLNVLLATGPTAERHNLLGSAYKRLSMLGTSDSQRKNAIKMAMAHYEMAYGNKMNNNRAYSLSNSIELASILVLNGSVKPGGEFTVEKRKYKIKPNSENLRVLEELRSTLNRDVKNDLDYWDMVAFLNIDICLLFITEDEKRDETKWSQIKVDLKKSWQKSGSDSKKIAELENLQFLIHSLNNSPQNPDCFTSSEGVTIEDKLELYINELRISLDSAWEKLKEIKSAPDKKSTKK